MKKIITYTVMLLAIAAPVNSLAENINEEGPVSIPALQTRLHYGDIIKEDDIRYIDVPAQKVRDNVVTEASEIIGKTPKRSIQANRPIRKQDVTTRILIEKGNMVDIIYQTRLIELKTVGVALDNGSKGDMIRVKNSQSGKIVQGMVAATGVVKVSFNREYMASLQ